MKSEDRPHGRLFDLAKQGDAAAQAEISRIVRSFARHVCRGGGPSGANAVDWEDVAQESLRKLFAVGLDHYRRDGSESSYLFTIVKCTVIEIGRSARRRQQRETQRTQQQLDEHLTSEGPQANDLEVRRILARLPDECRELLERVFLEGATYSMLARELGLAESSVRAKVSRCIRRARLAAGESEDG